MVKKWEIEEKIVLVLNGTSILFQISTQASEGLSYKIKWYYRTISI